MDNTKRNVHNSGPLGMLIKKGKVKSIEYADLSLPQKMGVAESSSYFKTQAGLEFAEHELMYVDPKECEPWKYANRQAAELGNMHELIASLKANKQLQPALIRKHPSPHDNINYEVIFGNRRHLACLQLGIPFLVILKEITNIQEAIACQDAENKFRNDVSHYSNAVLYQRLLADGIFKTEKELAEKLRLSTSSLNELMAFIKIPKDIREKIPDIHSLSKSFALKIIALMNKSASYYHKLLELAPYFGKTISSPMRLEKLIDNEFSKASRQEPLQTNSKLFTSVTGEKLFTLKYDQRGNPCFLVNKKLTAHIDLDAISQLLQQSLEEHLFKSGYPD